MKTITFDEGLLALTISLRPYPAYKYAPKWFKKMPTDVDKKSTDPNIKDCKAMS